MPTKTAPQPQPQTQGIATSLRQIVQELGDEFHERRDVIESLIITILAAQHGFLLGPPGTAKSALIRAICARITGARYWEILMDRQLGKEESFGPIDIPHYEKTGEWKRNITGTLADAHIAFVDEVGKAGPASLNPYLTAFNERLFKANGAPKPIPLITAIGASNEFLEPELAAMWDRFLVRMSVGYLQEPGKFAAMLQAAVAKPNPAPATTVALPDLQSAIQTEVPTVTLPPGVMDSILQLRADLASEAIHPSDRRFKQSVRLLQASAFLQGRKAVDDDDLQILQHVLWDVEEQRSKVQQKVLSLTSEFTREAMEQDKLLDEIEENIASRKGQSVQSRAAYGGEAQYKAGEVQKKLNDLIERANRQGRSTTKLETVKDRLKGVKVKIFVECLNMPADRAEKMA